MKNIYWDEVWHNYASQLIAQKRDYASRRVRELIDLDLQETLERCDVE